ncbi:MAG: hypothetical protein R3316_03505 [Rhodovibrionaceae bacterium]|nr:hypothetical protein [Rhodovibrionaceae bacterium]
MALAVTLAIVWGAVKLVHEGPAVDLVSGRWALVPGENCTDKGVLMQVSGGDVILAARDARLRGDIVWVAQVRDELRIDIRPRGLDRTVYALGFRRITPNRLRLVSAGFLVPPQEGDAEAIRSGERFTQYGVASVGLTVQRCRESRT